MAFTATVTTASLRLSSILSLQERITFTDLPGSPTSTVNWMTELVSADIDLKTPASPVSAANPNEVATTSIWGDLITATGTSHTLDLTALTRDACLSALDLTGKKLQGFVMQAPYANTATVIVVPGATNGYNLQNSATSEITLAPGGIEVCWFPESPSGAGVSMPDVAVADAEIDFSSGMTNFQVFVALFAG